MRQGLVSKTIFIDLKTTRTEVAGTEVAGTEAAETEVTEATEINTEVAEGKEIVVLTEVIAARTERWRVGRA